MTVPAWTQIASLGHGSFFQVEQAGGAVAYTTPFDEKIATLSAKLDDTRLYFGNEEEKERMLQKVAATDKLEIMASVAARARRGVRVRPTRIPIKWNRHLPRHCRARPGNPAFRSIS